MAAITAKLIAGAPCEPPKINKVGLSSRNPSVCHEKSDLICATCCARGLPTSTALPAGNCDLATSKATPILLAPVLKIY